LYPTARKDGREITKVVFIRVNMIR